MPSAQKYSRGENVRRMLLGPAVLAIGLVLVILLGRDLLARIRKTHAVLPTPGEVSSFDLGGRVSTGSIVYDSKGIAPDSPGEVLLAYTQPLSLIILPEGRWVLWHSGKTAWLSLSQFEQELLKRRQFLNRAIISD